MAEPVHWTPDGQARSARFNDIYHSQAGGLAQAQRVFMDGCGLPEAWRGRERFTVLETGFGLGLNFLACWAAWAADPQRSGTLCFTSVEAYPVAAADIVRGAQALRPIGERDAALLPHVQALACELTASWRVWEPGIHALCLADGAVRLVLAVRPVQQAVRELPDVRADAVFLDGFSPSVNPDMWSMATLAGLPRHSRPGTRLASYTVAAHVRRTLGGLGFEVRKAPGLPPKRHRLEAVFGGIAETT